MGKVHGRWCNSRTFKTVCKYCGESVFYFSCDCGSKLFFDELGTPWPIHRCAEFEPKPTLSRLGQENLSGGLLTYLRDGVAADLSRLLERSIERDYVEDIKQAAKSEGRRPKDSSWIVRQDPYHDCRTTEHGIITELIWDANIRKKAGLDDNAMGVAMLGNLAKQKLAQITIHTKALAENESDNCSFTFFVEQAIVKQHELLKGSLISAKLRGLVISSKYPIWVCDQLNDMY